MQLTRFLSFILNVFLLFTNTFLLCRFFLAWLIPQFLQKNQPLLMEVSECGTYAELQYWIYPQVIGYFEEVVAFLADEVFHFIVADALPFIGAWVAVLQVPLAPHL